MPNQNPAPNPDAFLRERLANADMAWRLSILFSPREVQATLRSIFVFYLELEDIFFRSTDADLQTSRLAWWRHELEAAADGRASHPVTLSATLPEVNQQMKAALDLQKTGGCLFNAVQAASGCEINTIVNDCGQRWFRLRCNRLRGKQEDKVASDDKANGLVRPLAVLVDNTQRYRLNAAGFGPLFSAWRAARRSEA